LGLKAYPVSPTIAPREIKITEKPTTKLKEWRNTGTRIPLASNISGPYRLARYTGTIGSTHGERKDNNPPLKAMTSDIFSTAIYNIMYLVEISSLNEKSDIKGY